jgi:hypothetical protein
LRLSAFEPSNKDQKLKREEEGKVEVNLACIDRVYLILTQFTVSLGFFNRIFFYKKFKGPWWNDANLFDHFLFFEF